MDFLNNMLVAMGYCNFQDERKLKVKSIKTELESM